MNAHLSAGHGGASDVDYRTLNAAGGLRERNTARQRKTKREDGW
jgi:hypothetical protein